jgi:dimethylglycine dehydrogenase
MDWLSERLPADGSITIRSLTDSHTILVVAGPHARAVLDQAAPRSEWSQAAFPWLSVRRCFIGSAEAVAMAVSFSGELAWELHIPNEQLILAYRALRAAGEPFGMAPFGLYATESMRLEKGYRHWKGDLITEFDPFESGLGRFVRMDKDFVGKAALERRVAAGPRRKFVSMVIDGDEAPAHPGDSVMDGDRVIGTVTSAAWGHRVAKNLAMAFVEPDYAEVGTGFEVLVLGKRHAARVCAPCLYDPDNERVRG